MSGCITASGPVWSDPLRAWVLSLRKLLGPVLVQENAVAIIFYSSKTIMIMIGFRARGRCAWLGVMVANEEPCPTDGLQT